MKNTFFLLASVVVSQAVPITLIPFEDRFNRPIDLQQAKGGKSPMVVVEQDGKIFVVDPLSGVKVNEVIDLGGKASRTHNEEGLLGLAFSPKFEKDHRFYVYYTAAEMAGKEEGSKKKKPKVKSREGRISRFTMDPETLTAERESEELLLSFPQDFGNHNGGWLAFGPDGHLYFGAGDGGAGNDPKKRAQDLGNLLGSILRIDVSGEKGYVVPKSNPFLDQEGAKPEIFAYGLRNPWRCAFDQKTGDFWIADVGQNKWEEVNFVPSGNLRGANFGWRLREATHETPQEGVGGALPVKAIDPIYEYGHDMSKPTDGLSITGGYVHRGARKDLNGRYFFGDFVSRKLWSIKQKGGKAVEFQNHTDGLILPEGKTLGPISSFGQDQSGEVYLLDLEGGVYRLE
ncbi:PQQ-dependent sugar dehydrogenase [Akkermansiaceae bacterium]|nr:PQQ-dependent sugar dehydrogenase [Akkermansiaceae bacterium]MDA7536925.1 PQQ-dependent sugar dehydrogenase [bacterium]MDA7538021.1 PQQ-dependent sugar dehydrogenase [Akkermansiaceae bacterium]MDA7629616.1 PQQ-dependent sugar dehydrogenase [Akkermansiaceae bacterium]MDB4271876.1 PQQ-dependent sugar dehydrogenase [Akkermansiaceae bacterium]